MRLLVATPVRGHDVWSSHVTVGYSEHLRALSRVIPVETIPAALTFSTDNIRARNRIAAHIPTVFPDVTHVLWWDDDQWPYDLGIVKRMIDSGEDMIGAPYTTKGANPRWVYTDLGIPPDERGLMQVHNVGFGFTMTTIRCLSRVSEGARRYYDTELQRKIPNIFGQVYEMCYPRQPTGDPEDETLMSEDLSFCSRWRALGGKIWIDGRQGNAVAHAGSKVYDGKDVLPR